MKTNNFFVLLALMCLMSWIKPDAALSQPLTDSTVNYYTLSAYYDHYYDSLIQLRGAENMQGTGYKDYLRWKWFYSTRYGVGGDLGAMWETMQDYYANLQVPENYIDESDWQFIGPLGIPLGHNGTSRMGTGKGMMLSLWVSDGDHSLIYAGSHHGGLWKTTDGGDSWIPLNDNDSRIHGVNSIAVNPVNPDILYISCGSDIGNVLEYSEGLFKSSDGGLSWDQMDLPVTYPVNDWKLKQRKVVLDPNNPDNVFFITYRDVYRSTDQGNNWTTVFHKEYSLWGDDSQWGFFDFRKIPWDQDIAYLAGSEIFKIHDPLGEFDATDISDEVFYAGLNPEDFIKYVPDRTEISIQHDFPNMAWFCYYVRYIPVNGDPFYKLRIVRYDVSLNQYTVVYENNEILGFPAMDANKFEFAVSPNLVSSGNNAFYFGGIGIAMYDPGVFLTPYRSIRGGQYPDNCWVHDDIRDLQIFSDSDGNDILYIADDSGISWGNAYEFGETGCADVDWHWRHPCASEELGLNVTEFYGIGSAEEAPSLVAGGCQDLAMMLKDGNQWINFGGGDGSELIFNPDNSDIIYFSEWQGGSLYRTNNKGESYQPFFRYHFSHEIMPMELDPINPGILYSGDDTLLQFNNVDDFSIPIPLTPAMLHIFNDPLTDIKVLKSGYNRRYFVSTRKAYNEDNTPSAEFEGCVYYSDDANEFTDISENLVACRYGFISGIEVNPENPDQIWVCASLYSPLHQNSKVYTLTMPGTNWIDYSEGLPDGLPVIKIKYLPFLNRLYAATDVGIFTRNIGDPQWYPFNTNLPAKIITDIDFNLPYKKIFASTFGRGLWETEFEGICDNTAAPLVINDNVTWSLDKILQGDIIIQDQGILEIDHCRLYMPENARIIVEIGGKLIIDGGVITNSCPLPWGGIEVWGSDNYQNFTDEFGYVELKDGAVIKNARVAISNYCTECLPQYSQSGGIIIASDAIFRNNSIAVNYHAFTNSFNNYEQPYRSSFKRCNFEFNQYKPEETEFQYFIKMERVNGIKFGGCDFINELALTGSLGEIERKYGSGIYSLGSQFYIDEICAIDEIPCPEYKPCTFTGLNYGIYAMGIDPVYTISVNKAIFRDNITGIYLSGIENASVTLNDFYINKKYQESSPPYDTYVGLYLDNSTGFSIEENYFDQEGIDIFHNAGIVVKDAGENPNEIYNNFFTNRFEVGIMALNKNRSSRNPDDGLIIKCNEFTVLGPFDYDILVIEEGIVTESSGIAQNQGSDASQTSPAGNLFSRYTLEDWKDYVNLVDKNYINYFMHDPNSNIRVEPLHYTENSITLNSTNWEYVKEIACYSHQTSPPPEPGILKAEIAVTALQIDSAQVELTSWVDGGNTEEVISEVVFSTPLEAYDLYSELILKSPYLSDTVLKESIQKEEVLDNVMIEDILVANPQSSKSPDIQETLDGKNYLLSEDQRSNIDQGKYLVSSKEVLESRVAWQKHRRAMILDDLITLYKNDTVNDWAGDSLISLLDSENNPALLYQLAFIRFNEGDSTTGMNVLNELEYSFDFDNTQQIIHQQYTDYAGHYSEIVNSDDPEFVLDSLSRSALYTLEEQKTFPGVYARNILQFFDTLVYIEPYILPTGKVKTGALQALHGENKLIGNEDFRIYPNPAMSYFVAEYSVQNSEVELLALFITDISGNTLQEIELPGGSGHKVISTKDLKPGLYLCKFVLNSKEKQTIKLSVIK